MQTQIGLIERQMPSQRSCQTLHTSEWQRVYSSQPPKC
jgi:hypothetical protein